MKSYRYDIHIHSALSPCADILLSPNNILNYATLQKLDIIAVTDHNSLQQQITLDRLQRSYDLLYIYGVEVTTKEGIHVLCYFQTLEDVIKMDEILTQHMQGDKTHEEQLLFDENDTLIGDYPYDLLQNVSLTAKMLYEQVKKLHGLFCLAHIDRYSDLLIQEILPYIRLFHAIEVSSIEQINKIKIRFPELKNTTFLLNSDAHDLVQIGTKQATVQLKEKSVEAFFQYFLGEKHD